MRVARVLGWGWVMLAVAVAQAQVPSQRVLEELFGEGTHAYYAGQLRRAYQMLSQAIAGGLQDPRAYYMRGVVLERLGRPEQAAKDFYRGAELEVRLEADGVAINRFLMRVQGRVRVKLERIRRQVRTQVLRRILAERRARYQALQKRQTEVAIPEDQGPDPLADQSDQLPPASTTGPAAPQQPKQGGSTSQQPAQPSQAPATPAKTPAGEKEPKAEKSPSGAGVPRAGKPKPGTLQAALKALGKAFGGLVPKPKQMPQLPVPVPGVGPRLPGAPAPTPPKPNQNQQSDDPFDF